MKKIILLFISLLLLSCTPKEPFELNEEYYQNNTLIEISNEEVQTLEKDKKSFAIFIYNPGCSTSTAFNEVLETFTKENQISIYKISGLELENTKINDTLKFYPSVVIYNQGNIASYLRANNDEDTQYYQSVDNFKEWFTKSVILKENI